MTEVGIVELLWRRRYVKSFVLKVKLRGDGDGLVSRLILEGHASEKLVKLVVLAVA